MSQAQYTSDIVRLIEEQGRQQAAAADRRGAIWGGALASLGQIPAQVQQMQRQKTHDALAQQEMGLRNQELGLRTHELDQRTKAFAQELIDRKQAHDDQAISQAGSFIHESGNTVEGLQSALAGLQKAGLLSEAEAQPILAGAQQDPTRVTSLALGMMSRTKEGRDRIEKTTTVKAGDTVLGFEGKPVFTAPPEAPKTAAEIAMAAQDPSLPQTERAQGALTAIQAPTEQARAETARHNAELERIAGLSQGRLEAAATETARHNKEMEKASLIRANKPPASAEKLTRVEHKGEDGKTVIEYLPQSALKGQTFEKGSGAVVENRLASAQAVNQVGNDMIAKLSNPDFVKQVGPLMGRAGKLRDLIGNPPPEFSELAGEIESYALATMGVHGMRSTVGAEQVAKILDQHHTPESLVATLKGLNAFANHLMENQGRPIPTPAAPAAPKVNPFKK